MTSEFIQRQIQRFLSQAEEALDGGNWATIKETAIKIIALDPENNDAAGLLAAAERALDSSPAMTAVPAAAPSTHTEELPTSFASGRYEVMRFLGEGGKKKVYLAHDANRPKIWQHLIDGAPLEDSIENGRLERPSIFEYEPQSR